jgi:hypothetical protein
VTFVVELPIVDLRALLEQHCLREVVTRQAKRQVCVALFSALNLAGVLINPIRLRSIEGKIEMNNIILFFVIIRLEFFLIIEIFVYAYNCCSASRYFLPCCGFVREQNLSKYNKQNKNEL